MPETNRIEYKRELNDKLEKEIVAFLNYREGGFIYIGVDDSENILGVKSSDAVQLKIKDRIKNNILPSCLGLFDVINEKREDENIIKITIASGSEKPYYIKKQGMTERGCFIRIGSSSEQMPIRMIEELFSKRTRNSLGKIKSHKQDLIFEQLKIYYNETDYNLTKKFASNLELLTEAGDYNYVGYLLNDKNNTSIKFAKYYTKNRVNLIESNEYGYCSLIKATKQILDKLELENKTLTEITSKERREKRMWNPIAIREAVINAIVHNDYSKEIPPKFEIFPDRLEITSAGSLPEGLDEKEFFEGYSVPRNKEIMRVFKDLEMVEHLGSGVPRILESYHKDCFTFSNNFIRMSFPVPKGIDTTPLHKVELISVTEVDNKGGQMGGQIGGQMGGQIEITKRQKEILKMIKENSKISRSNISIKLGINESAVQKHLTTLKNKGAIKRIGSTRGFWKVL
ncbi:MAG: putative DNA binding domain-containing protein [Flavobacteriaceae bacterium]|nr:putative DNA binding domain-containing protein [Flavobacteriaceae bacterium]